MTKEIERGIVAAILKKIRESKNRFFLIAKNRPENNFTITSLGFTDEIIEEIILELEADDCIGSLKKDKAGFEGHVFEFGKEIEERDVYIKFRVLFEKDICRINCISFHFPNFEFKYLFK